ncbi:hypothetical protein N1851_007953 [Merluccius polli]|uniref:Ig-like domain-containing protein n=1 Tax=Merluccius polli TaxID=89951 RepID=A0AA47N387_MERPO|nr:hypothetical protein N1851_007953 [Merluccius polli]
MPTPAANYTWFKDNTDDSSRYMNQGQQLVFGHIKSSDSGKYLCEAQNELGTKSASISINQKTRASRTASGLGEAAETVGEVEGGDQRQQVQYSVVNFKRPNSDMPEIGRISALYATPNNTLPDMVILKLKLWHWKDLTQQYKELNLPTVSSDAEAKC